MNSRIIALLCALALLSAVAISSAQRAKGKGGPKLRFSVQQLHVDNNEGCAVGDINMDGHPDITAGEFWYAGPDFKKHPLRKILPFGADYMENNGEHLIDVNGDGWLDVVSGAFMTPKLSWYENPGSSGDYSKRWKAHELVNTDHVKNENTRMRDRRAPVVQ